MCRTREENAEDLRLEEEQREALVYLQGVCRDCSNGTLNNNLNPAFNIDSDNEIDGFSVVSCNRCGSTHVDIIGG